MVCEPNPNANGAIELLANIFDGVMTELISATIMSDHCGICRDVAKATTGEKTVVTPFFKRDSSPSKMLEVALHDLALCCVFQNDCSRHRDS